jgi:hypothetical protein
MIYVSGQSSGRAPLAGSLAQWEDAKLATQNGSGFCSGASPPPQVGHNSADPSVSTMTTVDPVRP